MGDGLGQNAKRRCLVFRPKNPCQIFENFSSFSFHFVKSSNSSIQLLLFFRSYLSFSCPSLDFMNSLRSSSHLLFGLPTCLLALMLLSSPGCQLNTHRFHLCTGRVMILLAMRHFNLLCISIQHFILCFSACSSASFVLLLMYSIQSSSFSVASISPSAYSWEDTSLSWFFLSLAPSLRLFLCRSCLLLFHPLFRCPLLFCSLSFFFGLYFLFV